MNNPHGNMVDLRDPAKPILLVADRGNDRIVRYTLDDKPIDIVGGTRQPCHFHDYKDTIVVPDLAGPRAHSRQRQQGRRQHGRAPPTAEIRRAPPKTAAEFVAGQFVNPHGAIFDHNGNIFVAEWVEIGRVTKLRKVA